jgi:hypothetical protein
MTIESGVEYFYDNGFIRSKYKNLYFIEKKFMFLTTIKNVKLYETITHMNVYNKICLPVIKEFDNIKDMTNYLETFKINTIDGITCFFTNYYDDHIGHAIYDSFYPIYHAFLRVGYLNEPFNILYEKFKFGIKPKILDIYKTFSKTNIFLIYENIDVNIKFDELICGSAGAGITCVNKQGKMLGDDIDALEKFRNRMLETFKVYNNISNNQKITINIIDSDRYSYDEKQILQKICSHFRDSTTVKCNYINYNEISQFKTQLEIMSTTNIHISKPGTGMLNFVFLPNNSYNINLGGVGDHDKSIYSHYEVNCCISAKHVICEFYDNVKYKGLDYNVILNKYVYDVIYNLTNNIKNETQIPPSIKIWRELCNKDEKNMDLVIKYFNAHIDPPMPHLRLHEYIVYKSDVLKQELINRNINLNYDLINKLKMQYQ